MKSIPEYKFYKTKYGEELLVDVVPLATVRKYIGIHPVHTLSYFDITFITGGTGSFRIGGETYRLRPGDVLFSRPGEIREWDIEELPQGNALIFEEEFLLSFFNDPAFLQNLAYFSPGRVSARINVADEQFRMDALIRNIFEEIHREGVKDRHILRALLYEMLMLLNREYLKAYVPVREEKPRNRYAEGFVRLVDGDFKVHCDKKYYADKLCITPNYLNEIVRTHLGLNAKSYIRDKRIGEAKRQLFYTTLTVSEIADDLHFESVSYFIRLFRRQTGLTPLQFRQRADR